MYRVEREIDKKIDDRLDEMERKGEDFKEMEYRIDERRRNI